MSSRKTYAKKAKPRKRKTSTRKAQGQGAIARLWGNRWLRWSVVGVLACTLVAVLVVDRVVVAKFEGKKWSLPARVYARPLELYQGLKISPEVLSQELAALGYRESGQVTASGQMGRRGDDFEIYSRDFEFWDKREPARHFRVRLEGGLIASLRDINGAALPLVRLQPREIGGIYPAHMEDRLLVKLMEIPPLLGEALIAVEDRNFLDHPGVSGRAIARAALANMRAGGVVQGGSTLTQQLVKNFYLSQERSLGRKMLEALMSLLLELHYSKAEILETYINEVYLGQSGRRAIHGFALAAQHYFQQPLQELDTGQLALLVGLVKGASYYNPWRHPQRAKRRRDLVLQVMTDTGLITEQEKIKVQGQPLALVARRHRRSSSYPAFLDLVKRQLRSDYREEDLRTEGLRIFTSFDPVVQTQAQISLQRQIERLEQQYKMPGGQLQGATVVAAVGSGEVLAVVGDRNSSFAGFNRALDARRQVGSLIKPAVYLTALQSDQGYHLASRLSDGPVVVEGRDGSRWQPRNFSREDHGEVLLYQALAHSYNQSTARLGMQLGLHQVRQTVEALGVTAQVPEVPSMLLGSVEMSPLEVATMYHTMATEGFYTPLRAIRTVLSADGTPLKRYPLTVEQRFAPEQVYLLNYGLQAVMHEGTGRSVFRQLPSELRIAGKTGTTNDQRDSWFSGFTGDHLAVVWLGRDDNGQTPLTGATGALRVWSDMMARLPTRSMDTTPPERVTYQYVDVESGKPSGSNCRGAQQLPFIVGREPQGRSPCEHIENPVLHWWKGLWRQH